MNRPYLIINITFAGIIAAILLYSGIFSATGTAHPINCVHQTILGHSCASCGLSRAFSEAVRFNFRTALEHNRSGLLIFVFFIGQLLLRILFSLLYIRASLRKIIASDIAITILWFIFAWHKLIYDSWLLHFIQN